MVLLGHLVQAFLVGFVAWLLYYMIPEGLAELKRQPEWQKFMKCFARKRITLHHQLLRSGAIRKP